MVTPTVGTYNRRFWREGGTSCEPPKGTMLTILPATIQPPQILSLAPVTANIPNIPALTPHLSIVSNLPLLIQGSS